MGTGALLHDDFVNYQRDVWSRQDVRGYDELVDTTDVTAFPATSSRGVVEIAEMSAAMDPPDSTSKLAIIAPGDVAFGLGRMLQTYCSMKQKSTKEVGVVRSRDAALTFLGIDR